MASPHSCADQVGTAAFHNVTPAEISVVPANHKPSPDMLALPIEGSRSDRPRNRRRAPRTPLPLVPVIAVCAGVAIAYLSQTAHATQATYQAATLSTRQSALRAENQRLADELGRLRSAERVVAAVQQFGMTPGGSWAYVAAQRPPVIPGPALLTHDQPPPAEPVHRLIAALSGAIGPQDAEAASR